MSAIFLKTKMGLLRGGRKVRGVTLIETILYMVILTIVMGVIVQVFIAMGGAYKNIKAARELEISGTIALDSILREIRNASSVTVAQSVLGTSPGAITVSGTDEYLNPYTMAFSVYSGSIYVSKNGSVPEALTPSSVTVSYLVFNRVATSTSEGVKVDLELSSVPGSVPKSENFYGFTVLRGSY